MSKNIIIQEGGVGRQLTADKLKTALVGGGSCLWIPEDTVPLGTKDITEDGTYYASTDGKYGFEYVTVRGIGKVTGKDPVTGEETEVTTETDPTTGEEVIKKKVIPSSIRITTPPTRLTYNEGDLMDYAGMVVKAFLKSGAVFNDETYPDGVIPFAELDVPSVVPSGDDDPDEPHVTPNGVYYVSTGDEVQCCTQLNSVNNPGEINYLKVPAGVRFATFYNRPGNYYVVAASKEDFLYLQELHTWNGQSVPVVEETTRATLVTVDGEEYYYAANYWYDPAPLPSGDIEYNPRPVDVQLQVYAIRMMFGESRLRRIPVSWTSIYGKGETFTDTFTITVNPTPEPDPENDVDAVTGADP